MLNVYNQLKEKVFATEEYNDANIVFEINKLQVLSFEIPKWHLKHFELEGYIETKEQFFVIKEIAERSDCYEITCFQDIEVFQIFHKQKTYATKSVDFMLNDLLPSGWQLINKADARKRTVTGNDIDGYELIQKIIKTFEVEIIFDNKKKTLTVGNELMQDIGTYFTKELNLQEIFLTSESHELITRIIPIGNDNLGIESVNNGKNYIENTTNSKKIKTLYWEDNRYTNVQSLFEDAQKKLDQLSKFKRTYETKVIDLSKTLQYKFLKADIGDLVCLINSDTKTKEKFRITKLKKFINDTLKNEITLGNKIDDLVTDEQKLKQVFSENWEKTKVFFDVTDKNIKGIVDKQQLTDNNLERLKSTIEQTEEKIIQNVNNSVDKRVSQLKIGARNLLRNSASIDKSKWQKWSATDIEYSQIENNDEWISFESIKFLDVDTQITSKVRGYYSLNDFKVDDNKKYTLSLDFLNLSGFDINVVIDKAKTDKKAVVKALQNTRIAITFDKKDFDELIIGIETELNQNPIFCVKNIKIEEGTIATSWTPAIEDLEKIDNELNNAIEYLSSDSKDLLKKYDGLNLENAKIRKELNTALKQTRDEFLFQFNNYKQLLDETGRVVEQRFNDFSRYIRFKNGNIELGDINSPFKALLTHEKISFLKADAEVAYLSKNKLYITDAYIINSLRIGNFEIVPRSNGNLSIRKVVE
jgi:phage minor structural protein, N-terminal domain protein|nr:MAG TPA: tail protein [Caudoviricetes sp.]